MSELQYDRQAREYFSACRSEDRHPSLPGLALALGLDSAGELLELSAGSTKTAKALRRALSQVEEANVQSLYRKDIAGSAKFILQSSFGYAEKPSPPSAPQEEIVVNIEGDAGGGRQREGKNSNQRL